jgi:hypothetical protein
MIFYVTCHKFPWAILAELRTDGGRNILLLPENAGMMLMTCSVELEIFQIISMAVG